jgi:biopolymer transport protein ExbD/biopolymer transport protein TolR
MAMDISGKGVKSDINVTPLVDVVLVLLIIFMVITPMLQRGKAVQLPAAQTLSELKRGGDPIFLSVTGDGRIWVEKAEVALSGVADALMGEMAARPAAPLVLKGDRSLDYKLVRTVLMEVSKTHVAGISLAASKVPPREAK